MNGSNINPFSLPLANPLLARIAEHVLGLRKLTAVYQRCEHGAPPDRFLDSALRAFDVRVQLDDPRQVLPRLPQHGPLLVVANHPLGGLEGIALLREMLRYRPDTRVVTNRLLDGIPELRDVFIGVDILSPQQARENIAGIREARRHLASGAALLVFPAGKVATFNPGERRVSEHPWHRFVGSLLRKTGATVLPVNVAARNSAAFYTLSLVHPVLRTAMLPRELTNKRGTQLRLIVGELLGAREFSHLESDAEISACLRLACELVGRQAGAPGSQTLALEPLLQSSGDYASEHRGSLELQLDTLRANRVVESDPFDVYIASFAELGPLMDAIGLAREETFRAAGEGTGKRLDVDRFDRDYLHVFAWDKSSHKVVGGYRLGRVREIIAARGIDGLYARTLYSLDEAYIEKLGNPLELGRSFVHPDYQRKPAALDLLWRGIGRYVAARPEFNTLFGAVSISREHSDMSRALIAESMLASFRAEQKFLQDVAPLAPLKVSGKIWSRKELEALSHVPLVNKLVGCCDPGKALPTLLRHYLSLNGKFVCFSINKVFNDSLDGLILVDLCKVPKRYLNRYLGKQGASDYMAYWLERETPALQSEAS
ncbi:MAG: GNAT family N-acyltransferase [Pseudomonadales bacterium]